MTTLNQVRLNIFYLTSFSVMMFLLIFLNVSSITQAKINNLSYGELVGCEISKEDKSFFADNFDAELKKRGIPKTIKVKGKVLKIDKDFTINNCTTLYGNHKSVSNNDKVNGEYQYLGYSANGTKLENLKFTSLGRKDSDFLLKNKNNFIVSPKNNSKLVEATKKPWTIKPNPKKIIEPKKTEGMKENNNMTKQEARDTAIDKDYLLAHNDKGDAFKGKRGYFQEDEVGLKGDELKKKAVVVMYPDNYSFGMFYLYRKVPKDVAYDGFAYNSYAMPPLKKLFDEDADLAVSEFKSTNDNPWEKDKIRFDIRLKNKGEVAIKDPTAKFEFNGKYTLVQFKGLYKPGEETKTSVVTVKMPEIDKDTKNYKAKITANPEKDNPKNDLNYKDNNIKEKDITVKRIERDLSVEAIDIDGNKYFKDSEDKLDKYFEKEEVNFKYKLKFTSNKSDEQMINPVVKYGKKGEKQKEEQLKITIKNNEVTDWINPNFSK